MGLLALEGASLVWRGGITYDEPPDIAAGAVYRSAGLGFFTRESPPLTDFLRAAALSPLRLLLPGKPSGLDRNRISAHEYGQIFLFHNRVPAETIVRAARLSSTALLLLLGAALWAWGSAAGGANAGAAALLCLCLEPNLIAHGSLANPDIGVAVFSTVALAFWASYLKRRGAGALLAAGLFAGAAAGSKATGLALLPAMALSLAWLRHSERRRPDRSDAGAIVAVCALSTLFVVCLYGPADVHRFVEMVVYRSRQMRDPTPVAFFGRNYPEGHPLYFPGVLLVKTTIPLLAGTAWALAEGRQWKRRPVDQRVAAAFIAVVLTAAMLGKRQLGVRYLLPLYPLFCLLTGAAAADLWARSPRRRALLLGAVLWAAASAGAAYPHWIPYFNEFAGGPARGYRVLGDSNLDWGQTVPDLERFLKTHPGGLILSYFGTDCPREHGLAYQEAFCTPGVCSGSSALLPVDVPREWLAVSATKWQGYYESGPPAWSWLRSRRPVALLGGALFVYDVARDADAHRQLASMYVRAGQLDASRREEARARFISSEAGRAD